MKIAVCDDDKYFLSVYDDYFEKCAALVPKIEYDVFMSGESLLNQYSIEDKPYDILFLDIEMQGMNGLETAKKIRMMDDSVIIIYVTSHKEYVFESFEVSPFRFLIKPMAIEKFSEILVASCNRIQSSKTVIYFVSDRREFRLYCKEIYYIESRKRNLIIHTLKENHIIYGKLKTYAEKLYDNDFIQVHKSFLVNYNHVIEFDLDSLKMVNGDIIPISEKNRKYAKEEHIKFMLRRYKNDR